MRGISYHFFTTNAFPFIRIAKVSHHKLKLLSFAASLVHHRKTIKPNKKASVAPTSAGFLPRWSDTLLATSGPGTQP